MTRVGSRDTSDATQARITLLLMLATACGTAATMGSAWPLAWILVTVSGSAIAQYLDQNIGSGKRTDEARTVVPLGVIAWMIPVTSSNAEVTPYLPSLLLIAGVHTIAAIRPWSTVAQHIVALSTLIALVLFSFALSGPTFLLIAFTIGLISSAYWLRVESLGFPMDFLRQGGGPRRTARLTLSGAALHSIARRIDPAVFRTLVLGSLWLGIFLFLLLPRFQVSTLFATDEPGSAIGSATDVVSRPEADANLDLPGETQDLSLGFREDAFLSNVGRIDPTDDTITLRVRMQLPDGTPYDPGETAYLRGIALDRYLDNRFVNSSAQRFAAIRDVDDGDRDGWTYVWSAPLPASVPVEQSIEKRTTDTDAVFGLREPIRLESLGLLRDPQNNLRFAREPQGPYRLDSRVIEATPQRLRAARIARSWSGYLQLPDAGADRIRTLAAEITAGSESAWERCVAIERYLQRSFEYTLAFESTDESDIVQHFLFDAQSGYCVHFAASMILMLRTLDIPCRMAAGYATNERGSNAGEFIARANDSHAWVEVAFDRLGWIPFDPTPPNVSEDGSDPSPLLSSILDFLDGFSEADRQRLIEEISHALGPVLIWLVGALVVLTVLRIWWASRRRVPGRATANEELLFDTAFYREFLERLARSGMRRHEADTPEELADRAALVFPSEAVGLITRHFCETRYGGRPLQAEQRAEIRQALDRLIPETTRED